MTRQFTCFVSLEIRGAYILLNFPSKKYTFVPTNVPKQGWSVCRTITHRFGFQLPVHYNRNSAAGVIPNTIRVAVVNYFENPRFVVCVPTRMCNCVLVVAENGGRFQPLFRSCKLEYINPHLLLTFRNVSIHVSIKLVVVVNLMECALG